MSLKLADTQNVPREEKDDHSEEGEGIWIFEPGQGQRSCLCLTGQEYLPWDFLEVSFG